MNNHNNNQGKIIPPISAINDLQEELRAASDPIIKAPVPAPTPAQNSAPVNEPVNVPTQAPIQAPIQAHTQPHVPNPAYGAAPNTASNQPVNMRTDKDFSKARKHSAWVKRFKLLFPVAAGLILFLLIAFGLFYRQLPDNISVDSAALTDGKLVMDSPNLDGFDDKDRPYSVKADRAIQDLKNTDIINLEGIQAHLPIDDKNFAKIDAVTGTYDNKAQTLRLDDNITLNSSNGYIVTLQEADIDVQKGVLISNAPISVESPNGKISAQALEITDNGKRIVFKNRVKMTILPSN